MNLEAGMSRPPFDAICSARAMAYFEMDELESGV